MSEDLSYVTSTRPFPLMYKTIVDVLQEDVSLTPETECMIYRGSEGSRESLTYKELYLRTTHLAKVLVVKGVKKGDIIALLGPNTLERVVAEIGIILAGGVVLPLTMTLRNGQDILDTFNTVGCRFILVDPGKYPTDDEPILKLFDLFKNNRFLDLTEQHKMHEVPVLLLRTFKDIPSCFDHSKVCQENVDLPKLYPEETIIIFPTSGSTGKQKFVPHSHFRLVNLFTDSRYPSKKIKLYNDRPFAWLGGCPSVNLYLHMIRVFSDTSTAAVSSQNTWKIWNIIKEENCTNAVLMPYYLFDLIQMKTNYTETFMLDTIITTGQVIDSSYMQVVGVFTRTLTITYGMTESLVASVNLCTMKENKLHTGDVGTPIGGVEVKVVDKAGNITRRSQQGEICIRSPFVFEGYHNRAELNKELFLRGNWLKSGDIGHVTNDGRIVVQGRTKFHISRGTRKINCTSLESIIFKMQGLAAVVVVPVPDKRLYEEVCVCFTVVKDSKIEEQDVQAFCKEFAVEHAADGIGERPKYFVKFESFPKLFNGKLDRGNISCNAAKRLHLVY